MTSSFFYVFPDFFIAFKENTRNKSVKIDFTKIMFKRKRMENNYELRFLQI
jgi:hypothetical protein